MAAAEREEADIDAMEEHIWIRQNTVAQFIATKSILYLCEETKREPGAWMGMQWWKKAGIYLKGAREKTAATAESYKDGREQLRGKRGKLLGWDNIRE